MPHTARPPASQRGPVSQLRRKGVRVNRKTDDHDQLSGLFGPLSVLKVPAGHDSVEAESRDRKWHKECPCEEHSY